MADGESSEPPSPYLESLSGDAAERITAMKWARYLGAAFGPSGAMSALRYYVEVGWVSDDVRRTMVDYVRGLTIDELELAEVEPDLHGSLQNLEGTEFERHARSLQFVAAISGQSIEHGLASLQLAESVSPGVAGHTGVGTGAGGQSPSMGATGGPFLGGTMAPGEQAEMAAGATQRQRDRSRRDERARDASDAGEPLDDAPATADDDTTPAGLEPEGDVTASGEATATDRVTPATDDGTDAGPNPGPTVGSDGDLRTNGTGTHGGTDDPEDIAVSQADVTPGSVGGNGVETNGGGPDLDEEGLDSDHGAVAGDDPDIPVGDETVGGGAVVDDEASADERSDPTAAPDRSEGTEAADATTGGAADTPDSPGDSDPDRATPEPTPEPSPRASTSVPDHVDATFDDGDLGTSETDAAGASDDDAPGPDESDHPDSDGDRCIALTQDGDRCSRPASEGGDYCHQHAPE